MDAQLALRSSCERPLAFLGVGRGSGPPPFCPSQTDRLEFRNPHAVEVHGMARSKDFTRELDSLFHRRTHWLRQVLAKPRPGRPAQLTRKHRESAIERLQDLASEALAAKLARKMFQEGVRKKKGWHVTSSKGRGFREKRRRSIPGSRATSGTRTASASSGAGSNAYTWAGPTAAGSAHRPTSRSSGSSQSGGSMSTAREARGPCLRWSVSPSTTSSRARTGRRPLLESGPRSASSARFTGISRAS